MRQIHYHVGNLFSLPSIHLSETKAGVVEAMVKSIKTALHHPDFLLDEDHDAVVNELLGLLRHEVDEREADANRFSEETIIYYELVSIHDLLEELNHIHQFELRHQKLLEKSLDISS
ncbi:hypothetical protein QNH36_04200 [Mesobacillus sp. AQ2]|uniref:hypothetical protein n=1 Tax=Mesobacillus sp. AQ2 TaxID=3043332 RepID=UPI0024C14498|nr:hypothetical protein [Mesobacillus sp. AQ2]WHX41368.1 hypothetical protein QNH36_04200 [Mesobacillus sp. AQ2]